LKACALLYLFSGSQVKLNNYIYPPWAHGIGYLIVASLLLPLPIGFLFSVKKVGLLNVKQIEFEFIKLNHNLICIIDFEIERF
jgi:hypothetical protein